MIREQRTEKRQHSKHCSFEKTDKINVSGKADEQEKKGENISRQYRGCQKKNHYKSIDIGSPWRGPVSDFMLAHLAAEMEANVPWVVQFSKLTLKEDDIQRTHIQSALRGLRQAEGKFETNSSYVRRPCLKWKKGGRKEGREAGRES